MSRGELRRSVVTMMMPRSLHRCCSRERQREHCRRTWQQPFVRHGCPPFDGYETRKLFGVLSFPGFTPQLSRGKPRSGFTHPSRAAMRESGQLCVSLLPPGGASDLLKGFGHGRSRGIPCRAHSDKANNVPSDRSVTSCADAAGMVLVVLMRSTLLCEDGRALLAQIPTISESSRCHTHPSMLRISRQRF